MEALFLDDKSLENFVSVLNVFGLQPPKGYRFTNESPGEEEIYCLSYGSRDRSFINDDTLPNHCQRYLIGTAHISFPKESNSSPAYKVIPVKF